MNLALAGGNLAILVDVFSSAVDIELVFGVVSTQLMGSYTRRPEVCDAMSLCECACSRIHTTAPTCWSSWVHFCFYLIAMGFHRGYRRLTSIFKLTQIFPFLLELISKISGWYRPANASHIETNRNTVDSTRYSMCRIYIYIYILTFIDDPYWWHIRWRFCWAKSLQSSLGSHRLTTLQFTL